MKKYLSLIFGLTLIAGGLFVSFSEASRDAYHVYLMNRGEVRDIHFREKSPKTLKKTQKTKLFNLQDKYQSNSYYKARNYKRTRKSFAGVTPPRLQFPQNRLTFRSLRGVKKKAQKAKDFRNSREKILKKQEPKFKTLKLRTVSKNYRGVVSQKKEVSNTSYKKIRNYRNTRRR